ncbi:hypothetical protein P9A27_gp69 [Hafnia phage yong1]|uniref:Uncharacterized protein n=1 Tax=Hafnia phage yong1 TaxID=2719181 RepID=A0A7D5JLC3_9CAUD|nr:hypothetical protein P9A27_gp69 [Hafnia phage yong1]QLF80275.1 hypothetical protein [Hafnia phage yong1]
MLYGHWLELCWLWSFMVRQKSFLKTIAIKMSLKRCNTNT